MCDSIRMSSLSRSPLDLPRDVGARQGRETDAIVARGTYVAPSGREIDLRDAIARAVASREDYPEGRAVRLPEPRPRTTRITMSGRSSLAAAKAFAARGIEPLVLNFASAKNPGGGYTSGARAQEESLARCSALVATIRPSPMYTLHRGHRDALYTGYAIHSAHVPVFRDDEAPDPGLLDEPYPVSFLTAPAPNRGVVVEREPRRAAEADTAMRARVTRILSIAAAHGHGHLVLGAWGCGVFRNDPELVAEAFREDLAGPFHGVFEEVTFAVLDTSKDRRFAGPFERRWP